LQRGRRYAPRVRRLAGPERDSGGLERPHGLRCARHVGPLGNGHDPVADEGLGIGAVELVLGGARERHLAWNLPDACALLEVGAGPVVDVLGDAPAPYLLELLDEVQVYPVGVVNAAARVTARDHVRAELLQLLDGVDGDVAGPAHHAGAPLERFAPGGQHLVGEIDAAVASGLLANPGTAPVEPLARQHAGLVTVRDAFVLTEEIADLPLAHADVAGGDVHVLAEVSVQLRHEALTETHDLALALALGVEVAATLAGSDGHAGERVLEYLLEGEELDGVEGDAGMEPQATFVRSQGAVELDSEPTVHLHLAAVIRPRHAE